MLFDRQIIAVQLHSGTPASENLCMCVNFFNGVNFFNRDLFFNALTR